MNLLTKSTSIEKFQPEISSVLHRMVNKTYGELTILSVEEKRNGRPFAVCQCSCGRIFSANAGNIRRGQSKSCGCMTLLWRGQKKTTHGHCKGSTSTSTYKVWEAMIRRCYAKTCPNFPAYGGRGIQVCDRWRHSFENFLIDMGERPVPKTIDRIDNDGNYEPSNCRWATRTEQCNNKRTNRILNIDGCKFSVTQVAEKFNKSTHLIIRRLNLGWSDFDAVFKPVRVQKNNKYPIIQSAL